MEHLLSVNIKAKRIEGVIEGYCQVKPNRADRPQHARFTTGLEPDILGVGHPSSR